ncbi:MAG: MEDS domain-containing protein [Methanomassiliicoccales archaeon]
MQMWPERFRKRDHVMHIFRSKFESIESLSDLIDFTPDDEIIVYVTDLDIEREIEQCKNTKTRRSIEDGLDERKLRALPSFATYCPDEHFEIDRMLRFWEELSIKLSNNGYRGATVVGDISWLSDYPSFFDSFVRYECAIDLRGVPDNLRIMCQYDSKLFSEDQLDRLARVHQLLLQGGILERRCWVISRKLGNFQLSPSPSGDFSRPIVRI